MRKTTILIDEQLLKEAMRAIGARSKKDTSMAGLQSLVQQRNRELLWQAGRRKSVCSLCPVKFTVVKGNTHFTGVYPVKFFVENSATYLTGVAPEDRTGASSLT